MNACGAVTGPFSAIPWTVARQASLSIGFSRQEYWRGLPFPPPGDLPDTGTEPTSPASLVWQSLLYHCTTWEAHTSCWHQTTVQQAILVFDLVVHIHSTPWQKRQNSLYNKTFLKQCISISIRGERTPPEKLSQLLTQAPEQIQAYEDDAYQGLPRDSPRPSFVCLFFKFLMWTIFFKYLLNLLKYHSFLCFGFFVCKACGSLAPWPGIKPHLLHWKAMS